jgi:hypothetical protein
VKFCTISAQQFLQLTNCIQPDIQLHIYANHYKRNFAAQYWGEFANQHLEYAKPQNENQAGKGAMDF